MLTVLLIKMWIADTLDINELEFHFVRILYYFCIKIYSKYYCGLINIKGEKRTKNQKSQVLKHLQDHVIGIVAYLSTFGYGYVLLLFL